MYPSTGLIDDASTRTRTSPVAGTGTGRSSGPSGPPRSATPTALTRLDLDGRRGEARHDLFGETRERPANHLDRHPGPVDAEEEAVPAALGEPLDPLCHGVGRADEERLLPHLLVVVGIDRVVVRERVVLGSDVRLDLRTRLRVGV